MALKFILPLAYSLHDVQCDFYFFQVICYKHFGYLGGGNGVAVAPQEQDWQVQAWQGPQPALLIQRPVLQNVLSWVPARPGRVGVKHNFMMISKPC